MAVLVRLVAAVAALVLCAAAPVVPSVDLFDTSKPDLGLQPASGTQTITVFHPGAGDDAYANGVVLFPFRGRLYAQWQSSQKDEDSPDTHVVYATSADGVHWTKPRNLIGPSAKIGMHSSGGWWSDGKTLTAFINRWPEGFRKADGSHPGGQAFYAESHDGVHWSAPKPVLGADGRSVDGIIEQDPHRIASGRIVTAFHLRPGMIATPFYTDDPTAQGGWHRGVMQNMPHDGDVSRELEPSLFQRPDGTLVMIFRDEAGSFRLLASESADNGAHWSTPVVTEFPDARAKLSAGTLPDGTIFIVNAPGGTKLRAPLAVSLSADGRNFIRSYVLRGLDAVKPPRQPGQYKRPGFHYPKSVVWNGYLYVGYSDAKEDVVVTRVPLAAMRAK